MSASDRFATMPVITAFSRAAFFPPCALKSASCLCRYSGNWPAIFGLAGADAVAVGGVAGGADLRGDALRLGRILGEGRAGDKAAKPTASAHARIIPSPPAFERRDFIRISAFPMKPFSQAQFLLAARQARRPAAGRPARAGLRRPLQRRQVERDQRPRSAARASRARARRPGRTQTINFYDARRGARAWSTCPGYGYARVPQAAARAMEGSWSARTCESRAPVGVVVIMDARHPLTPLDRAAARLARRAARAGAAVEGGQALARRAEGDPAGRASSLAPHVRLFSSVTRQGVEECRDLLEAGCKQVAGIKSPR